MAGVTPPSALPAPTPSPNSQTTTAKTIQPRGTAPHRSPLILAVAALLFSVMALCAKAASQHIAGPQLAWLRFLIGALLCLLPVAFGYRLQPQSYRALTLRGLFGSFAVLAYFLAISHLPVGIATLLNSSSPLFVALFSFLFLRERLPLRTLLALLVTAIGVVLVVLGNAQRHAGTALFHGSILWALLGLFSAILSGAAVTTVRSMRQTEGSLEIYLTFCCVGGLLLAVPGTAAWVWPSARDLFWILAMGLSAAVAQVAMTHALRDVRAVSAALILQITPVATLLLGALFLAERLTPLGLGGAALTLLGITWGTISR